MTLKEKDQKILQYLDEGLLKVNKDTGKILFRKSIEHDWRGRKPVSCPNGYHRVYLDGLWYRVSRIVLIADSGLPPEGKTDSQHLDDNKKNNCCANLKWGSRSENIKAGIESGVWKNHEAASRGSSRAALERFPDSVVIEAAREGGNLRQICERVDGLGITGVRYRLMRLGLWVPTCTRHRS